MNDSTANNSSREYYIGIDTGSISVNSVVITSDGKIVHESPYYRHFGKIEDAVHDLLKKAYELFGEENIKAVAFTGNHGKKLSHKLNGFYEFETISQLKGALFIEPGVKTVRADMSEITNGNRLAFREPFLKFRSATKSAAEESCLCV